MIDLPPPGPKEKWPGDLKADAKRLRSLQDRVHAVREEDEAAAAAFDPAKPSTGMGLGLKMGMDLTVATLIGFGLGSLIDWALGTFPLMGLILCGLGFAAGIRMVLASAHDYREHIGAQDPENQGQRATDEG